MLRKHKDKWRRIRIEGHTLPPKLGEPDDWELSSKRAAVVARVFASKGHIPSYLLAVAGRAGQDPQNKERPTDPANERVEIIIEYAKMDARGIPLDSGP